MRVDVSHHLISLSLAVLVLLAPSALPAQSQPAGEGPLVDNELMVVRKNSAPCGAQPDSCDGSVILALSPVKFRGETLERADFVVIAHGDRYESPTGGDFIDVEMKSGRPAGKPPAENIPSPSIKTLRDEPTFFIYIETLEPGETRPRHSHGQRLMVLLDRAEVALIGRNDQVGPKREMVPDRVIFEEATVHTTRNVGTTRLRNWALEIK